MEPSELAAVAGRYRDMIYRVALHWCGHPQEAEDATQDTLLKLCATHRTFADEEHLKSWLIRVTINHCKSRLRAPWHTRRLPLEELPDTPVFDDPAQRELYDAVLALPQAYRIVLYLFYYEDIAHQGDRGGAAHQPERRDYPADPCAGGPAPGVSGGLNDGV